MGRTFEEAAAREEAIEESMKACFEAIPQFLAEYKRANALKIIELSIQARDKFPAQVSSQYIGSLRKVGRATAEQILSDDDFEYEV